MTPRQAIAWGTALVIAGAAAGMAGTYLFAVRHELPAIFERPAPEPPSFVPSPPIGGVQILPAERLGKKTKEDVANLRRSTITGAVILREGSGQSLDESVNALQPWEQVAGRVAFQPARIGGPIETFRLLGYRVHDEREIDRLYARGPDDFLRLQEWDFKGQGGGMILIEELQNVRVNGQHAQFMLEPATGTRKVIYHLRWNTGEREYRLAYQTVNEKLADKAFMLALAESVRP